MFPNYSGLCLTDPYTCCESHVKHQKGLAMKSTSAGGSGAIPSFLDPDAPELSLLSLANAMLRQWKWFLIPAGFALLLGLFWIFGTPPAYQSNASILLQNARGSMLISAGSSDAPTVMQEVTQEQLNSELEVLKSTDLLDEVVEPGWRSKPLSTYSVGEARAHEAAVAALSGRLDVSVARQSHVLLLKLSDRSPETAQRKLQRLLQAFLARQRQIGRPPGATQFFADQADTYRVELAEAQAALARFQQQHGMVTVAESETTISGQVAAENNQLREINSQISGLQHEIATEAEVLKKLPLRQVTVEHTAPLSGALDQLTTQLLTLQNQRVQLLTKFKLDDRLVQQVDTQIAQTEASIHTATSTTTQDTSSDISPTWQHLQTAYTQNQATLSGLQARGQQLAAQIASLRKNLSQSESVLPDFSSLQHRVTELDANYQLYVQKRNEAQIADAMDRQDLLNFAIIESPTFSVQAVHPKPRRDMVLNLVTACFLGAIGVFLAESARNTVACAGELECLTQFPVLATLPLDEDARPETTHAEVPRPAQADRRETSFRMSSPDEVR